MNKGPVLGAAIAEKGGSEGAISPTPTLKGLLACPSTFLAHLKKSCLIGDLAVHMLQNAGVYYIVSLIK